MATRLKLPWGRPSPTRDLEEYEVERLRKTLQKKARGSHHFYMTLGPPEIKWIEENVAAHLIEIHREEPLDGAYCAIGIDEATANAAAARI